MKLKAVHADVWTATIDDRPGGAADKLEPLSKAGANFEFVLARRTPEQPGKGMIFVFPVKGAKVTRAAQDAGFIKSDYIHSIRIEGADKPGTTARVARALAVAGVSFRGMSATAIGRKFVSFVAVDTAEQAASALGALKKLS